MERWGGNHMFDGDMAQEHDLSLEQMKKMSRRNMCL